MFCPVCGNDLKDGQSVCDKCGSTLSIVINQKESNEDNLQAYDTKEIKKKNRTLLLLSIGGAVLFFAGIILSVLKLPIFLPIAGLVFCIIALVLAIKWKNQFPENEKTILKISKWISRVIIILGVILILILSVFEACSCKIKKSVENITSATTITDTANEEERDDYTLSDELQQQMDEKSDFIKENIQ